MTTKLLDVDSVLQSLKSVKKVSGGWIALCPAHDDKNPSLKISKGNDGNVLLHCHAGCDFKSIVETLNLPDVTYPSIVRTAPVTPVANKPIADVNQIISDLDQHLEPANPQHPYLLKKQITPYSLFQIPLENLAKVIHYKPRCDSGYLTGDILVVKIRNVENQVISLEFIDGQGRKSALAHAPKKGGYWFVYEVENPTVIAICEGVATAITVDTALAPDYSNLLTVATLSANNLQAVATALKAQFPLAKFIICADLHKGKNEPIAPAVKVAKELDCQLAVPVFSGERAANATDFNDLAVAEGNDAVSNCLEQAAPVKAKEDHEKKEVVTGILAKQAPNLVTAKNGNILTSFNNLVAITEYLIGDILGFNTFSNSIEIKPGKSVSWPRITTFPSWIDHDTASLMNEIAADYAEFPLSKVYTAVQIVAGKHQFNPPQQKLKELLSKWDGQIRTDSWLVDYLGVESNVDNAEYLHELGRKWLIGAVARVMQPGCQRDDVLIFQGEQGIGKSSVARAISEAIAANSFTDTLGAIGSNDSRLNLQGIIIAELSEFEGVNKSEIETVKAFITTTSDRIRAPYERSAMNRPRTCSFIGSTNDNEFLKDSTGNRRFWPVFVPNEINLEQFKAIVPQLLGEAMSYYAKGEQWHITNKLVLTQANEIKNDASHRDPWEAKVLAEANAIQDVTIAAILFAMNIATEKQTTPMLKRIANILRMNGWDSKRKMINHIKVTVWYPKLQSGHLTPTGQHEKETMLSTSTPTYTRCKETMDTMTPTFIEKTSHDVDTEKHCLENSSVISLESQNRVNLEESEKCLKNDGVLAVLAVHSPVALEPHTLPGDTYACTPTQKTSCPPVYLSNSPTNNTNKRCGNCLAFLYKEDKKYGKCKRLAVEYSPTQIGCGKFEPKK